MINFTREKTIIIVRICDLVLFSIDVLLHFRMLTSGFAHYFVKQMNHQRVFSNHEKFPTGVILSTVLRKMSLQIRDDTVFKLLKIQIKPTAMN